jgi:hypothetical protein
MISTYFGEYRNGSHSQGQKWHVRAQNFIPFIASSAPGLNPAVLAAVDLPIEQQHHSHAGHLTLS